MVQQKENACMEEYKTAEEYNLIIKRRNAYTGISYGSGEEAGRMGEGGGVPYLYFPVLQHFPFLRHGYSTRLGGVSTGVCSSMSFSEKCGDTPAQVVENFRRISTAIGLNPSRLVLTDQIHEAKVQQVSSADVCSASGRTTLSGVDGIVTAEPGLTLVCFTADCVPLFFADPVRRAIGVAHAGWRGTAKEIGKRTVQAMQEGFGSRPEDLYVAIGPSICAGCYEVDQAVADAFASICPAGLCGRFLSPSGDGLHYQLDLWQANKELLIRAGIPEGQIQISGVCTCCNSKLFFSHRATGGRRGLLAGFLSIQPE